jgi:glycosyltransferase involved in cell wall biosynthesis
MSVRVPGGAGQIGPPHEGRPKIQSHPRASRSAPRRPFPDRVLLVTDTAAGVWTHTIELAGGLAAEGVQPILASLGAAPSPDQLAQAGELGLAPHHRHMSQPWLEEPWTDPEAAGGWLVALGREAGADLVHLSEPVLAALEWGVPTVAVSQSCVLSWWEAVLGEPAPASWERYREAMRRGLTAAGTVVVSSRAMGAALRRHYGVPAREIIPNGRRAERFPPGPKEPLVLTATRLWDGAKNAATLDRAAANLPWPVYAAGDPTPPGGGEQECCTHLRLLGRLPADAVAAWLGRAAVFALPARYEPFGLSPLEAALAGCALVLGDIPSLREQWDGVAIFVPPDDGATLQGALTALIDDPPLRQLLAMRARRRALGLSPRRMALRYLETYAGLLHGSATSAERKATTCAS